MSEKNNTQQSFTKPITEQSSKFTANGVILKQFIICNPTTNTIYAHISSGVSASVYTFPIKPNTMFVSPEMLFEELFLFVSAVPSGGVSATIWGYKIAKHTPQSTAI